MYVYSSEIIGGNLRTKFISWNYTFYAMGGVFVNLISIKFNFYKFYIYLSGLSVLICSVFYFYLIETPFYYYKKKDIENLYKCLVKIASRNFPREKFGQIHLEIQKKLCYGPSPVYINLELSDVKCNSKKFI